MERRSQPGVYCIFTSMEMGRTFSSKMPRFPTDDPDYRIIRRVPSRYLHHYFYIRDPVIGPLSMCIGTYLPFQTTYYLNGHNFIEIELRRQGVAFRKDDNAFLSTSDPKALPAAADSLSASTLEKRLNYWTWLLGPKFAAKDRKAVHLKREYSIHQIEYCRNFTFKRRFPSSGSPPTRWLTFSASASPSACAASYPACSKNSTMAITRCASTARTWWAACKRSSAPSCAWRSA
jgi:hypothetical protein